MPRRSGRGETPPFRAAGGARGGRLPRTRTAAERDPLEYRRARLGKLRADGSKDQDEMKKLEGEIAELEKIKEIRGTEDLLTRPARWS